MRHWYDKYRAERDAIAREHAAHEARAGARDRDLSL